MLARVVRRTVWVCAGLALIAVLLKPDQPRVALGVVGGGVLVGLAFWALMGLGAAVGARDESGRIGRISHGFQLVKFFTRHAMLALAAYVMMVRLHLDPVGMLIGVTSVALAASVEAMRRP